MHYGMMRHDVSKHWRFIIDESAKIKLDFSVADLNYVLGDSS